MKKNIVLSLATCAILASGSLFVGCGSSSSQSGSKVTKPVVNSYLVNLPSPAKDKAGHISLYNEANRSYDSIGNGAVIYDDNNKTTGKIKFNDAITGIITVPANAIIDSNGNWKYDKKDDKPVGFVMKGEYNSPITPLSTYAVETNRLPKSLNKDPIKELINSDNPAPFLAEHAIINAIKLNNGKLDVLKDLNVTDTGTVTSSNTNLTSALAVSNPVNIAAVKVLLEKKKTDVPTLIKAAEIHGNIIKTVQDAIEKNNLTKEVADKADLNESAYYNAIKTLKNAESETNDAINNLPAKLLIGSIKLGDEVVTLDDNNTFTKTIDTTDKNITDFYDVSFGASVTKVFTPIQNVGMTVTITDKTDTNKSVSLKVEGANINPSNDNKSVIVTLPVSSRVTVIQNGISGLEDIMTSGAPYIGNTNKELTMSDLGFNINTVLESLNSDKIPEAIAKLNDYISIPRTYTVNINITGIKTTDNNDTSSADLVTDYLNYTGTVKVINSGVASSSSSSTSSASSEAAESSSSSEPASSSSSTSSESSSSSSSTGLETPPSVPDLNSSSGTSSSTGIETPPTVPTI